MERAKLEDLVHKLGHAATRAREVKQAGLKIARMAVEVNEVGEALEQRLDALWREVGQWVGAGAKLVVLPDVELPGVSFVDGVGLGVRLSGYMQVRVDVDQRGAPPIQMVFGRGDDVAVRVALGAEQTKRLAALLWAAAQ